MIIGMGSTKKLGKTSGVPQMNGAFSGWTFPVTFTKLTTTLVDFEAVSTSEAILFNGVIQPLKDTKIAMKPERQRAWNWQEVHAPASIKFAIGDKLLYEDVRYKVMAFKGYFAYGFVIYHLAEDYEDVAQ